MSKSVFHLLLDNIAKHPNEVAAQYKKRNQWQNISWQEVGNQSKTISKGLVALGISSQDRVGILAKTSLEWVLADLGIGGCGAITVPIYHSSSASEVEYIINNSGIKIIFIDDQIQYDKIIKNITNLSSLSYIIRFESDAFIANSINYFDLNYLINQGKLISDEIIDNIVNKIDHKSLASIVYTSGTTGLPKGVMITHDSLLYEASAIEKLDLLNNKDVQLLFLPLAHIFAKIMQITWLKTAHLLVFAESIEKAVDNMAEIQPTIMASVPRMYEKVYAQILQKIQDTKGFKGIIARKLLKVAIQTAKNELNGINSHGFMFDFSKQIVLKKVGEELKKLFGGRLRFFISGGAPLSPEINYFFKYCGITILEGYGLTETCAASFVNLPVNARIGTVGKPLPGTEVKIANDSEILIRGRGVFSGYWNNIEETKKVIDEDAWFHTGDIGVIDKEGFLKITDRKKDIIVTAGGKKIAPQKIENLLKAKSPLINQAIVIGDKKPYLVALIAIDSANALSFIATLENKSDYANPRDNPSVIKEIKNSIDSVNINLASFEQIKKYIILDRDFTIGKELTATLKVRRNECITIYQNEINELYK